VQIAEFNGIGELFIMGGVLAANPMKVGVHSAVMLLTRKQNNQLDPKPKLHNRCRKSLHKLHRKSSIVGSGNI